VGHIAVVVRFGERNNFFSLPAFQLLKEVEGIGQGRRRKQLLDAFKKKRRYWNLEKKALGCTLEGTVYLSLERLRDDDDLDCNPGLSGS